MPDLVMPSSVEVERAILGACMIGGTDAINEVYRRLDGGNALYNIHNKKIFSAIYECSKSGVDPDLISVVDALRGVKELEEVGGPGVVAGIAGDTATVSNLMYHCNVVVSDYNRRQFIVKAQGFLERAYDRHESIDELYAESRSMDVPIALEESAASLEDLVALVADEAEEAYKDPSSHTGTPTGIPFLDNLLGGWQDEEMIVIAARPSQGKTSLGIFNARHSKKPTYFISAEMSKKMLATRMLASEVGIPSNFLRAGDFTPEEFMRLQVAESKIANLPIFIDDKIRAPKLIYSEAHRMKRSHDIGLIVVDYLQLLDPPDMGKNTTRDQQVGQTSKIMKSVASDLGIPAIVLAQLNRNIEYTTRRPQKSDLRDSGEIEQTADVIIFLHPIPDTDVIEMIVDKNRNGPTGYRRVRFTKETGSFSELET